RRRVSSAILPSFRGTLKSSRTRTLLPATSTSSKDAFTLGVCLKPLGHVGDQVDHPAAEPPLVVVPTDDLGCALTERDGQRRIDYRRVGIGLEVGGHQRLVADGQDAAQFAVGGFFESGVDVLRAG